MIPKLRAWDDINEKMIYDFYREKIETVDGWYKGELVVRNKNEIHCDLLYSSKEEYLFRHVKELPLMQSTSLKDKNGVEIFEGDVVKVTVNNYGTGERFEQIDKVVYEDCRFCFNDGFYYSETIKYSGYENKEVIGNIHENPELLEVK
ncbi:TPA: hypothetical protein OT179_001777 [Enterococcus faecalis]|nr:hypothetical protein [Enterococcus faecalis]